MAWKIDKLPYTFDTSALIQLFRPSHYDNRKVFGRLWYHFDSLATNRGIWSVREAFREIEQKERKDDGLEKWARRHKGIFLFPSDEEIQFIREMFMNPQHRQLVKSRKIKEGSPVADPFVIAQAKTKGYCVVTQEKRKENSPRIPNVCDSYGIEWVDLLGFMDREGLRF